MTKQHSIVNNIISMMMLMTLVVLLVGASSPASNKNKNNRRSRDTVVDTSSYTTIKCPPNKSLLYHFKTTTLIGNSGVASTGSHKGQSGRAETILSGSIILTCPSRSIRKQALSLDGSNNGNINQSNNKKQKKNVVLVTFNQVSFQQFRGRTSATKKYRKLDTRRDLTSELNKKPFLFTQSDSGHVQNLIFKQSEQRYVRSIKKGLIRMLTTETRKRARSQTDGFGGKYHTNYNKQYRIGAITKTKRSLVVHQKFTQDDFITALPVNKRQLHYEGTHLVTVSLKRNLIREAYMKLHFTFGPSKFNSDSTTNGGAGGKKQHYAFKEFEKLTVKSKSDKLPEKDSTSELETLFIGKIQLSKVKHVKLSLEKEISETILNLEQNGRSAKLGNEFTFENSFSVNKFDKRAMNQLKRREFSTKYFKRLLNGCKQDASLSRNSNILLAALAKYSKLHPIKSGDLLLRELKVGIKKLNKLSTNSKSTENSKSTSNTAEKDLKSYLESIQNLVATIKSERIQNALVKLSTLHSHLSSNFIYASIVIPYPTESSFKLLKSLKNRGLKKFKNSDKKSDKKSDKTSDKKSDKKADDSDADDDDEYANEEFKQNAFMAYSDLASRIRSQKIQREIVKEIITRIGQSENLQQLTTNFHALNNAGRAVQVEILEMFLKDERIPDTIKTLIVENLKKRLRDEDQLDDMVHSILGSTGYSSTFKSALINAQSEREKHLRRGQSVTHVVSLHRRLGSNKKSSSNGADDDKNNKKEEIRTAIRNYLYTVGSDRAGDELAKMMKLKKPSSSKASSPSQLLKKKLNRSSTSTTNTLSSLLSDEDLELLDQIHSMDQNVLFRRFFRRIGNAFRRVGRAIGGHIRRIGSRIKNIARKVGRAIVRVARAVAKGVVKAVKWIKDKLLAAINAVKKIVEKIKYYFSKAKFENQKACMQVSRKAGDELCLYHPAMIEFVRKQGDLSTIKKAKHFSFESLLGTNAVHMYLGFLVYAGASFECSAENSGFDFVLLAKANMNAKLFKKELVIIGASVELTKRPNEPLNDNIYVKVFQTTFINANFVPEKIRRVIEACFSEVKPLVQKRFPKLVDYHYQFSIGPIPVNFNFNVALNMGVELRYGVCVEKLEASASVEPYVSLSVSGSANVGVPVAKVGVYLKVTITYRIVPRIAFEKCNLCAMLQHKLEGIQFDVGLVAAFMKWKKEWKFFRQQTKAYVKTLFEKCIGAGNYKPSDNDSKKLELTSKRPSEQATSEQQPAEQQASMAEQEAKAEVAAQHPDGYQANPPELANFKPSHHVDTPEELQAVAKKKGLGSWAKKTSDYKPLFGPEAEKIPISSDQGLKPPRPSRQSLRRPVTLQKVKAWTSEFLREHVPQEVLEKIDLEKLRHLPDEYFHLHMSDRVKIPLDILESLRPDDLKHFIEHLPKRYNKKADFNPPPTAFTHVWSHQVLQHRLPPNIYKQVPLEYLRNLPEEILQIRKRILAKIPLSVWKKAGKNGQAIVNFICTKYRHLCKRLIHLIKSDTGKDMTPQPAAQTPAVEQAPVSPPPPHEVVNNTPPVVMREYNDAGNGNGNRRGGRRGPIYMDVNININKKPVVATEQ